MKRKADAYLPVVVHNAPCGSVFDGGQLKPQVAHYARLGVVRVIAGPVLCHLVIDVRRPYYRPRAPTLQVGA